MILCRTLGPVHVSVDGGSAPASLQQRKNFALLVYLARSPLRARTREHLVGMFWQDRPEAVARHSLREVVHVLRRSVGDSGLVTEGDQVRLAGGVVELDVDRFEELAARQDWAGASALVAGEFLEGLSLPGLRDFDYWLSGERQFWRDRSVDALVRHGEGALARGDVDKAAAAAQRAMTLEPASDAAARVAIKSAALAGDRARALERYDAFARRLKRELGAVPDAETQALAGRVRRERAWRVPAPPTPREGEPAVTASRRAPLVGRGDELARLLAVWRACREARCTMVAILEGDSGSGKTRLAQELLARIRLDGDVVSVLRAVEADLHQPCSGVLGLVRGGLLDAPGLSGRPPEVLAAIAADDAIPPGRALVEVLRAVGAKQPVALFLDDAQWLDRESLLALVAATRDLASVPLTVVFAVAQHPPREELDELRARIGRDVPGVVERLAPLDAASVRELAGWALPAYSAEQLDRVTRRVMADSAGFPLLAVELLHAIALGLEPRQTQQAWPPAFKTLEEALPGDLPDAVIVAIRMGFRRLSPDAQKALASAAVLGGRLSVQELGRTTGLSPDALAAALDELEWQRWLTSEARGYSFLARVVREVVARDMLTPGQRKRIQDLTLS